MLKKSTTFKNFALHFGGSGSIKMQIRILNTEFFKFYLIIPHVRPDVVLLGEVEALGLAREVEVDARGRDYVRDQLCVFERLYDIVI